MPPADPFARIQRARLLARIHRRYVTRTQPVRVGPIELSFTRVADPDRVLDEVADEADRRERLTGRRTADEHLHLPYWAELWDSAIAIGQWLAAQQPASAPTRSVLDLGCGMGLAGTVAAAVGHRVLFADIEPPALLFARLNSLPWSTRVRARRTNWRTDRLAETFELILGADILYERAQWEYLDPFWRAHLAPGGTVLLGEPGRQTGELFVDWIGTRGWQLQQLLEPIATSPRPMRIFQLRRAAQSIAQTSALSRTGGR